MSTSKCQNQEVDVWVVGHLVTQFQGQILRAAANNRVRGHASVCGYDPPSPTLDTKLFIYVRWLRVGKFDTKYIRCLAVETTP